MTEEKAMALNPMCGTEELSPQMKTFYDKVLIKNGFHLRGQLLRPTHRIECHCFFFSHTFSFLFPSRPKRPWSEGNVFSLLDPGQQRIDLVVIHGCDIWDKRPGQLSELCVFRRPAAPGQDVVDNLLAGFLCQSLCDLVQMQRIVGFLYTEAL